MDDVKMKAVEIVTQLQEEGFNTFQIQEIINEMADIVGD